MCRSVEKSTVGNVGSVEKSTVGNVGSVEKSTVGNVGSRKRPRAMSKSSVDSRERRK
jgi:hypothetical protein